MIERWLATEGRTLPELVGQLEFIEVAPDNHLRHSKFIGLREDKPAPELRRE